METLVYSIVVISGLRR